MRLLLASEQRLKCLLLLRGFLGGGLAVGTLAFAVSGRSGRSLGALQAGRGLHVTLVDWIEADMRCSVYESLVEGADVSLDVSKLHR